MKKKNTQSKKQVIVVPTTQKNIPKTKTLAQKSPSPVLYFQCMSDHFQKGYKGQKITQVAKNCKANSPTLVIQRTKQIKEVKKALSVVSKFTSSLEKALVNH